MNNKTLILLIVVIAAVTIVVVSWRTPGTNTGTPTPTPTATPTVTDPFAVTPTVTTTATPTPTVTTTVTATPTPSVTTTTTPTPTPTVATSFEDLRDTAWMYGVSEQTVGSTVYFVSETEPTKVKKNSTNSETGAQTVFTSDNAGKISKFFVNGTYIYVATKRDATSGTSKLQRMVLSNGSKAKLYEFSSTKYEVAQFSVLKSNDSKSGFYIGLEAVVDNASPMGMYVKNYSQQWMKTFTGVDKTAAITGLAPNKEATQLAGLFLKGATQTQAYVELE